MKMFCEDCNKNQKVTPKLYYYICSVCSKTLGQRVPEVKFYVGGEYIGSAKNVIINEK